MSFYDPIIFDMKSGQVGDEYEYVEQTDKVINSKIICQQIPDKFQSMVVTNGIKTLSVTDKGFPTTSLCIIDYLHGHVLFHESYEGQIFTLRFWGRGINYAPASRIYSALDQNNNVAQTLQDFVTSVGADLTHFGVWDSAKTYVPRNIVFYNNASYMCIKACTNITPTDTTYWMFLMGQFNHLGSYDSTKIYKPMDAVEYVGSSYMCIKTTAAGILPTDTTYWVLLASGVSVAMQRSTINIASDTRNVPIGIQTFNSQRDTLMVFQNMAYIEQGVDYNIAPDGISIDRIDTQNWKSGTQLNFVSLKNITNNVNGTDASLLQPGGITNSKLGTDIKIGSLATLKTINKTSVTEAINENTTQLADTAKTYDTFSALLADTNNLFSGKKCNVLGFYAKYDCSRTDWYITPTTGSEIWVDSGYGFSANTSLEIKINNTLKAVYSGKNIETRQFGCKADGVSDDSKLLILLFTSSKLDTLNISNGTHIINITAGINHNLRFFIDTMAVTKVYGNKGKSTIKLGSGNGDERSYKGFHSLFNYHTDDIDVIWEGVTFDYNIANNPVYQTTGQYIGVENNIGLMALSATGRSLTVTNCTFKDCAGTNVIYFAPRTTNTGNAVVKIASNKFQNMGLATKYVDASNNTLDAYHDCSTISIHNVSGAGYSYTLTSYVHDNEFIGADTNAYNTCECTANIQYFYNNTVRNYVIGVLVEPSHKNLVCRVYNNNFLNVQQGVSVWTQNTETAETNEISYKMLEIKGNYILVDPITFRTKKSYYEYTTGDDGYILHFYHCIRFSGIIYRNIDTLSIRDNTFEFTYVAGATASKQNVFSAGSAYGSYHSGQAIGFWQVFDSTTQSKFTSVPFLTNLQIKGNKFKNIYRCPILCQTYPRIDYVDISDNQFYNCLIDSIFYDSKEVCKISFPGNTAQSPYTGITGISAYVKSINFQNNTVIDTLSDDLLVINIDNQTFNVPNSMLNYKGNIPNNAPINYMFNLKGVAASIGTINSDTTDHN